MSATKDTLLKRFPHAKSHDLDRLSTIWDEVVCAIIENMLDYSDQHISDIHINLREEMILELARLQFYIADKVVNDRLSGRLLEQIDENIERESCFNEEGIARISNTAITLAEHIWVKKYKERWEPKTSAAIQKETTPKTTKLAPKRVEDNHFVPKSFIKRYWSENDLIFRFTKNANGEFEREKKTFGQWGFAKNLYSDRLEAYFGLLEGDAVRPIEMLLSVKPLNRPQREALVGFIVIQRLRNPHFMASLNRHMRPIVAEAVGIDRENDPDYMRSVYETLYESNDFYDKLASPIYRNQWVIVRSKDSVFVLPDTCNIFGMHNGEQYVVMPITPNDCLVVMPFAIPEIRIVPHYVNADSTLARDISNIFVANAKNGFLAGKSFQYSTPTNEAPNNILPRIISSIAKIIAGK